MSRLSHVLLLHGSGEGQRWDQVTLGHEEGEGNSDEEGFSTPELYPR